VHSKEWNDYSTDGTYTVSFDRALNSEIILGSSLTLIGTPVMPTLTAKAGKRHFGVTGSSSSSVPIKTLKLENLRLYGGGSSTLNSGGSIYVKSGALQITNCIIEGNEARAAGAIYVTHIKADNTALKNVTFKNNKATAGYGGVFSINYGSAFPIIDCTFIGNFASQKGGVVNCGYTSAAMEYATFVNNTAGTGLGHDLSIGSYCTLYIMNSKFQEDRTDLVALSSGSIPSCNSYPNNTNSPPKCGNLPTCEDAQHGITCSSTCENPGTAGISCEICPVNTYAEEKFSPRCTVCPNGRYTKVLNPDLNSASNHNNLTDCKQPPKITNMSKNNHSSMGEYVFLHAEGFSLETFGNTYKVTISTNGESWTNVARISDWVIAGKSPPGTGANIPLSVSADGIPILATEITLSYAPPNITGVLSPPFKGGTITIEGSNFGLDPLLVEVHMIGGECGEACTGAEVSGGNILCQYDATGESGVCKTLYVTVNGQRSNEGQFCYEFDKGEMIGVPAGVQRIAEKGEIMYELGLSTGMVPTADVNVQLLAASSDPQASSCTVEPALVVFPANWNGTTMGVRVNVSGNNIDEGTSQVAFTCTVLHTVSSADGQYATSPSRSLSVSVVNDDTADIKLWTIDKNDNYAYDTKFLSFFAYEGEGFEYGVRLNTEPTHNVTVIPVISLVDSDPLAPPVLTVSPPIMEFSSKTWSRFQRFTFNVIQDRFDNSVEDFNIVHKLSSDDQITLEKLNARELLATVRVIDDDEARLLVNTPNILTLVPGGSPVTLALIGLNSEPVYNVSVELKIPNPFIRASKLFSKVEIRREEWDSFSQAIDLEVLEGAPAGVTTITLLTRSEDPKYNTSASSFAVDVNIPDQGKEPSTILLGHPPAFYAWQHVLFIVASPEDGVKAIEWRLNNEDFRSVPYEGTNQSCPIKLDFIPFGKYRFEARAVTTLGQKDSSPSVWEFEISHCNDANLVPQQYASIKADGALECIDCPHLLGSNCKTQDVTWDGVYAEPGWWTAGTKSDTYYKCPIKSSCLGGRILPTRNITLGAVKSECAEGYAGVLCALCDSNYYMSGEICTICPESKRNSTIGVALLFCGLSGLFIAALCRAMYVKDSKAHWKGMKNNLTPDAKSKGSLFDRQQMKNIKMFLASASMTIKTFIGFVQILSVSNTAFKIPWPAAFLTLLQFASPFNFDFIGVSGVGCLVPYDFFASFGAMMLMPMAVMTVVLLCYFVRFQMYKCKLGKDFTSAMQTTYTNRVLQFTMWVILIIYPPVSRRAIQYFICSEHVDGAQYLVKDYSIRCFHGTWNERLPYGIAFVSLYPLGIPLYFAYQLRKHRHELDDRHVLNRFGFLYAIYRREMYLWDIWEMLQKLFLTGIIALIFPGKDLQVVIVVLADLGFLCILLLYKPHTNHQGRNLAMMASVAITLTMYCGLVLKTVEGIEKQIKYRITFDVFLIGINLMVTVYAIKLLIPVVVCRECCKSRKKKKKERATRTQQFLVGLSEEGKQHKILRRMSIGGAQRLALQSQSLSRSTSLNSPNEKSNLQPKPAPALLRRSNSLNTSNEKVDPQSNPDEENAKTRREKHGMRKIVPKTSGKNDASVKATPVSTGTPSPS
jgi:hypothetical protein